MPIKKKVLKEKPIKMIKRELAMEDSIAIRNLGKKFSKLNCVWDAIDLETKEPKQIQTLKIEDWLGFEFHNGKKAEDSEVTIPGKIIITYDENKIPAEHLKTLMDEFRKSEEKMTKEEFRAIPFYSEIESLPEFVTNSNNGLMQRKSVALEIAKRFEKIGIKRIDFKWEKASTKLKKLPTVCFDSNGTWDGRDSSLDNSPYFYNLDYELTLTKNEPFKMKIDGEEKTVGYYLPNRNVIVLGFNFLCDYNGKSYAEKLDLKENKILSLLLERIETFLKPFKIKTKDISKEQEIMTLESFLGNLKSRAEGLSKENDSYKQYIADYEHKLITTYRSLTSNTEQLDILTSGMKNMKKYLKTEMANIRKLAIVNKVTVADGFIQVEYIPTCFKVPNFQPTDSTKKFGKREIYVGRMIAKLYPDKIVWSNLDKFSIDSNTYYHPHVNNSGNPCYGSGDASNLISKYLGSGDYTKLIRYLWMWIQTCRDGHGYSHSEVYYNHNLKNGFPVWDEKGELIQINDKSRIKSGEQMKLEPAGCMEDNLKLFKDFKKPR